MGDNIWFNKLPDKLYKTTIVIWSEYDPTNNIEIDDLARDAMSGESYCSKQKSEYVDPRTDPDWDGTDFFGYDEDPDGEDQASAPVKAPGD